MHLGAESLLSQAMRVPFDSPKAGAMPIALQLWVFKAAPETLEGGAALMVSTFQIFIACIL
jgi:hypothetical protein